MHLLHIGPFCKKKMQFYQRVNRGRHLKRSKYKNHVSAIEITQDKIYRQLGRFVQQSHSPSAFVRCAQLPINNYNALTANIVNTMIQHLLTMQMSDIGKTLARLHMYGTSALFQPRTNFDIHSPTHATILYLEECDVNVLEGVASQTSDYLQWLNKIFHVHLHREKAFALQRKCEKVSLTYEERKSLDATCNPISPDEAPLWLQDYYHHLKTMTKGQYNFPHKINLDNPKLYLHLDKRGTLEEWRQGLLFLWIDSIAPLFKNTFMPQQMAHMGQIVEPVDPVPLRIAKIEMAANAFPDATSRDYVANFHKPWEKQKMQKICELMRQWMLNALDRKNVLQSRTREGIFLKIQKMSFHIGWEFDADIKPFESKGKDAFDEMYLEGKAQWMTDVVCMINPWREMGVYVCNAWYVSEMNTLFIPCALFQPPFITNWETALGLGEIVNIVAHEITHAFDSEGKHIDSDGQYRDWWDPKDEMLYAQDMKRVAKLYKGFQPRLTMTENIADILAIHVSYCVFQSMGKPNKNQLRKFFTRFARNQYSESTPKFAKFMLKHDYHSQSEARVNIVLSTLNAWRELYRVKTSAHCPQFITQFFTC